MICFKHKITSCLVLIFTFMTWLLPDMAAARDAYMWGENDRRTRNIGITIPTNYKQITGSPIKDGYYLKSSHASPTIIEDINGRSIMFVKDSEGQRLYCFKINDVITKLWSTPLTNTQGQPSTVYYFGKRKGDLNNYGYNGKDVVLVGSGTRFNIYDAWTGVLLVYKDITVPNANNKLGASPLIYDSKVYLGSNNGTFYIWDLSMGMLEIKQLVLSGWLSGSPALIGDKIIFSSDTSPGKVYVVDKLGNLLKTFTAKAGVAVSPVPLNNSEFFVLDKKGNTYIGNINNANNSALPVLNDDLGTGANKAVHSPALGGDGYVYFTVDFDAHMHGHIYGVGILPQNRGRLIHLYEAGGPIVSAPTVTGDAIFFAEEGGAIVSIDKITGKSHTWLKGGGNKAYTKGAEMFSSVVIGGGKHNYVAVCTDEGVNVFAPDLPNLCIPSIVPSTGEYHAGTTQTLTVTVKNDGPAAVTGPFKVNLYKNSISPGNLVESKTVASGMPTGAAVNLSYAVPLNDVGNIKYIAFADAGFEVEETDETDNTNTADLNVKRVALPGQVFADFNIVPNPVAVNAPFDFEDLAVASNDTINSRTWHMTVGTTGYDWTTDETGRVLSGRKPVSVSVPGTYPATYTVRTVGGRSATATKALEVTDSPPDRTTVGEPPVVDFDVLSPIWAGDTVQITDKSYDPDGYIRVEGWEWESTDHRWHGTGWPDGKTPGEYNITRWVMDNDGNYGERSGKLVVLERVPTADIIPGTDYLYPTVEATNPFPYELRVSEADFKNISYVLPDNFDYDTYRDYEVRFNGSGFLLFKKDDCKVFRLSDNQLTDITPPQFFEEKNRRFLIKDIQWSGHSWLVAGYWQWWGHYDWTYAYYPPEQWFSARVPWLTRMNNGAGLKRYSVQYPNLAIRSMDDWVKWNGYYLTGGADVKIFNDSPIPAGGFHVAVTGSDGSKAQVYVDGLGPGELKTVRLQMPNNNFQQWTCMLDSGNAVRETNESDNSVAFWYAVGGEIRPFIFNVFGSLDNGYYRYSDYSLSWADSSSFLLELDNSGTIVHQTKLYDGWVTNTARIVPFNNNTALISLDGTSATQNNADGSEAGGNFVYRYNYGTKSAYLLYRVNRPGVSESIKSPPFLYPSNLVWTGRDYYYNIWHFISNGPAYPRSANVKSFAVAGNSGYFLSDLFDNYYLDPLDWGVIPYSSGADGNSSTVTEAVYFTYNPAADTFSFKLYQNKVEPDKWRWKLDKPYQKLVPFADGGFLAFTPGTSDIVEVGRDFTTFTDFRYIFLAGFGIAPSQTDGVRIIDAAGSADLAYLIAYVPSTGKQSLVAYDGLSLVPVPLPPSWESRELKSVRWVNYETQDYLLFTARDRATGQMQFLLYKAPAADRLRPLYFSTFTDYHIPVGAYVFHNELNSLDSILSLPLQTEVTITKTLIGTTAATVAGRTFNLSAGTRTTASNGADYVYETMPFRSEEDAEYIIDVHANPGRLITEQNYLQQPLYHNNTGRSRFYTIDLRPPLLAMSKTEIKVTDTQANRLSRVTMTIFQTNNFEAMHLYAVNKATGAITTLLAQNVKQSAFDYYGQPLVPGDYEMHLDVMTKTHHALSAVPVPFRLVPANRPPLADFTWSPNPVYEGDNVTLINRSSDPDNDPLTFAWTVIRPDGSSVSYATANVSTRIMLNNAVPGIYRVTLTARDAAGQTGTVTKSLVVNRLEITGYVGHTPEWDDNRKSYNRSMTGTDNSPRGEDVFWAGERFVLAADTTDTGSSATKAESVTATLLYNGVAATLTSDDRVNWSGGMWQPSFEQLPDGTYTFRFRAVYSNGVVKTDDVTVVISGSYLDFLRFHRSW